MKKLITIVAIAVSGFVNGQYFINNPNLSGNPLSYDLYSDSSYVNINMDFIDTLINQCKNPYSLTESFISDIETNRYNKSLRGIYEVSILSYYVINEIPYYRVSITNNLFYTPEVFKYMPASAVGTFFTDLINIEMSLQKGTLLQDIDGVFNELNKQ